MLMRQYRCILVIAGAVLLPLSMVSQDQVAQSIAFWRPRTADLLTSDSPDAKKLAFLLKHTLGKQYTVESGDTLDEIIRAHYYLSTKAQPRAFLLYLTDILRRNPGLSSESVLHPQQTLYLPVGPKYGALELSPGVLSSWKFAKASASALYQKHALVAMGSTRTLSASEVQDRVQGIIGFQTSSQTGEALQDQLVIPPLESRRVTQSDATLNSETIPLLTSAEESVEVGAIPSFLAASLDLDFAVDCKSRCTSCNDLLKGHMLPRNSLVRVMIADSGIDPTVAPTQRFLYPPSTLPPADFASNKHGTFVYSEISSTNSLGVISDSQLYVSSVVGTKPGDSDISWKLDTFPEVVKALTEQREHVREAFKTTALPPWIVNISASGKAPPDIPLPPFLGGGTSGNGAMLLFVAAAGNNGGDDGLLGTILFAMENNPSLLIVGAIDEDGQIAPYSNRGAKRVDVFERGSCVCGFGASIDGGTYKAGTIQLNGTSQAAPIVSAAAALLSDQHPRWAASDVKARLVSTGILDGDYGDQSVGGLVDIEAALKIGFQLTTCSSEGVCLSHEASRVSFGIPSLLTKAIPLDISSRKILRMHATTCAKAPGTSCFRVIDKDATSLKVLLHDNAVLKYIENGVERMTTIGELKDVVLPVYQKLEDRGFLSDAEAY